MRRGTPEYNVYMEEVRKRADEKLSAAYRTYSLRDLEWDWSCNISKRAREILAAEFARRGIIPGKGAA